MAGRLVLAATPIGDAGDASARLRVALESMPIIAAEDTRRLIRLCRDLGVTHQARVVSFFEGNERHRVPELVEVLRSGSDVLLVTDAGMPSVSDPGYRLVAACLEAGLDVTALPGPSAVLTALALSGLPVDRFSFDGFLPRRAAERRSLLTQLQHESRTMVFFEAPHRLGESLGDMAAVFGPSRAAAVCRELTKTYEEVRRGPLSELMEWAAGDMRGEITIVVQGFDRSDKEWLPADLARMVGEAEAAGLSRKDAIAGVVDETGVRKRDVFDAVVAHKPPP